MIDALLSGALQDVQYVTDPVFGVQVPQCCFDVPAELLTPRTTWPDPAAYDEQAGKLARMFTENFKTFADAVPPEVANAGPKV
jgi:phosphoenolpyruvate carboxykinase (ATP)